MIKYLTYLDISWENVNVKKTLPKVEPPPPLGAGLPPSAPQVLPSVS